VVTGVVALAVAAAGAARADVPGYSFQSLATLDSALPGGGTITHDFEVGTLNDSAVTAFVADVTDDGKEGAFLVGPDGKLQVIALTGQPAPNGGTYGTLVYSPFQVNNTGNLLLTVDVDRGDGGTKAVYYFDKIANRWTPVLEKGMPAPAGGTFNGADRFSALNDANTAAVTGDVTDSAAGPAGDGVFLWSGGKLTTVARPGTKVDSGVLTRAWRPTLSPNAIVAFEGTTTDSPDSSTPYSAYIAKDGVITELATPNTPVPASTDNFAALRGPHANSQGDVVMLGQVGTNWGVFLYTAADKKLQAIVKPGDTLPGGGTLTTVENYRHAVDINDDGAILFGAQLDTGDGIYLYQNGKISLVAKTGQDLKSVGTAANLANDGFPSFHLALNSKGQITFPVVTTDGKTQLVLATPAAPAPAAGP
jgi:hypothetical protein